MIDTTLSITRFFVRVFLSLAIAAGIAIVVGGAAMVIIPYVRFLVGMRP